jgi:drug/metabolite transporter (DMT)-like permease
VLAVLWLRERLNWIQLVGIALSLVSIYLFNVATVEGVVNPWLMFALIPIGLWGVSGLLQKISTNDISGELSALWFLAAFVPVAVALLVLQPLAGPVALKTWLLVMALGLFFSLGNFAILLAFASAGKASIIAPLAGLYPLVSVPIAILFLGEKIGPRETAGIVFALVSVAALSFEKPAAPDSRT